MNQSKCNWDQDVDDLNDQMSKNNIKEHVKSEQDDDVKSYKTFEEMNLKRNLLKGIYAYGFQHPSLIQQKGIMELISSRDIIAQSQSGTGKTATFGIGCIQSVDESLKTLQAIIICPTRELAAQIKTVIFELGRFLIKLNIIQCVGGDNVRDNIDEIKSKKPQIIVGTPGRIFDLINRHSIITKHIKTFCLDEADEMLSQGFKSQIHDIFKYMPEDVQACVFSATLSPEIINISKQFLRNPRHILLKKDELTLEGISQFYVEIEKESQKLDVLMELYQELNIAQAIIYVNSKKKCDWLQEVMQNHHFTISSINGQMQQSQRTKVLNEFRSGKTRILITTDLLCRGIDVQQVSIVINFDIPYRHENYIHRIGRSGRFGRKGAAINLIISSQLKDIKYIENYYHTHIHPLPENFNSIIQA